MRLRSFVILLLAAAIIFVGAMLPKLAGAWQDASASDLVSYAQISGVELQVDESGSDLSMRQKLSMLGGGYAVSMEIPESLAKLSSADLGHVVEDTISKYQELGLMASDLTVSLREQQPYLIYWDDSKTRSNIFWNVFVYFDGDLSMSLIVDDQTKTVCTISYGRPDGWYPEYAEVNKQALSADAQNLCQTVLEELGSEFSNYDPVNIMTSVNTEWSEGGENGFLSFSTYITWSDILFGQIHLSFYVNPSGFRTYIW